MLVNPKATFDPVNVLREFIADVEAVGVEHVKESWPDLYMTYLRAKKAV